MENDINMWLAKVWEAINRLSIMWKLNLSDKIKNNFFHACLFHDHTTIGTNYMDTKCIKKMAGWQLDKNDTRYIEQAVWPPTLHL